MKKIILLLSFLSFSTAFAQTAGILLAKDIMASKKLMKTDTKIYNYFYMEKIWPGMETPAGRYAFVNNYLSQRAGNFWNPEFSDASTKNYATGAGLYFAIDPHISKQYGNSFIQLTIPAGTPYINVVSPLPMKKETVTALIAEGFFAKEDMLELFPKRSGFYRDTLRAMVLPKYTEFRKLVQGIFEANNIQFIEYNFNSSLSNFCTKHTYSAFDFVGTKNPADDKNAILSPEFSNLEMYSTELEVPNQTTAAAATFSDIVKFRTTLEDIISLRAAGKKIPKELIPSRYSPEELKALKASTYSCDN